VRDIIHLFFFGVGGGVGGSMEEAGIDSQPREEGARGGRADNDASRVTARANRLHWRCELHMPLVSRSVAIDTGHYLLRPAGID
jgi:hypothetical protein